jgi:hypothetical protein
MKTRRSLFENVIIRLLYESHAEKTIGQAVFIKKYSDEITAVIYDQNALLNNVSFLKRNMFDNKKIKQFLINTVYKGIVQIKPPTGGNCHGAWQVSAAAGPGLGKTLYGLGYALSPSGLLMSDRKNVSQSARGAWSKVFSSSRKKLPLDDSSMHDSAGNSIAYHPNHTPETDDDCAAFSVETGEQLNYAYEKEGWEDGLLNFLEKNHEMTMSEFAQIGRDWPGNLEEIIWTFAPDFWDTLYVP